MTSAIIAHRPPRIALLLIALATLAHALTPLKTTKLFTSTILAVMLASGGFAIMIVAWRQFKNRRVAICPTEKTASLITNGIYRVTRNPMYLGITMMLSGLAVWIGTFPFYAAAAAFFAIVHVCFCPYEEAKLLHTFGQKFQDYADNVRRWI